MKILSHRGFWKAESEKNSEMAFIHSFKLGFGIETDVRDLNGRLVISHDPPTGEPLPLEKLFETYKQYGNGLTLALNIKADGLWKILQRSIYEYDIHEYFVFDMSIPDTIPYLRSDMRVFTRLSEYEKFPPFHKEAAGIWMDCFEDDWITQRDINKYLEAAKKVCIVSPELHKREYKIFWSSLVAWDLHRANNLMICTDHPQEARLFFNG